MWVLSKPLGSNVSNFPSLSPNYRGVSPFVRADSDLWGFAYKRATVTTPVLTSALVSDLDNS